MLTYDMTCFLEACVDLYLELAQLPLSSLKRVATPYLPAALAIAAILVAGLGVYRKGWIAIRNGNLNINALMSIAVTGAVLILSRFPSEAHSASLTLASSDFTQTIRAGCMLAEVGPIFSSS